MGRSINRNSYLVDQIPAPAFVNERDWLERLGEEILGSVPTALSVVLYGSWAKRKVKSDSDVDLLLIVRPDHKSRGPEVHERIDETRGKMTDRFWKACLASCSRPGRVSARLRKRDALVREIVGQGRVLAGSTLAELVGRG